MEGGERCEGFGIWVWDLLWDGAGIAGCVPGVRVGRLFWVEGVYLFVLLAFFGFFLVGGGEKVFFLVLGLSLILDSHF